MAYTIKPLGGGLYDILENGVSIRQGGPGYSADYASKFGTIPALAASGAPAPTAQPPQQQPAPVAQAPMQQDTSAPLPSQTGGNGLIDFASKINDAVNFAKKHRNSNAAALMRPGQGTVAASDFSSILSNLNSASDSFGKDLTKTALDASKGSATDPQYRTVPGVGVVKLNADGSGYDVVVAQPGKTPATDSTIGGGAPSTFTKDDKSAVESALRAGTINGQKIGNPIGSDGYIDPAVYVSLMNYWISQGGTKESYFSNFNYKNYINPANTWVWDQIGVKNPYKNNEDTLF